MVEKRVGKRAGAVKREIAAVVEESRRCKRRAVGRALTSMSFFVGASRLEPGMRRASRAYAPSPHGLASPYGKPVVESHFWSAPTSGARSGHGPLPRCRRRLFPGWWRTSPAPHCCRAWRDGRGRASRQRSTRSSWWKSPCPSDVRGSGVSRCRARPPLPRPCRPESPALTSSGRASQSPAPQCPTARRRRNSCKPRHSRPTISAPPPPCHRSGGARGQLLLVEFI